MHCGRFPLPLALFMVAQDPNSLHSWGLQVELAEVEHETYNPLSLAHSTVSEIPMLDPEFHAALSSESLEDLIFSAWGSEDLDVGKKSRLWLNSLLCLLPFRSFWS